MQNLLMHQNNLKYRDWLALFCSMASRLPIPRYFLRRTPSEKKYSPGASVVPAKSEPIITGKQNQRHAYVQTVGRSLKINNEAPYLKTASTAS